MAYGYNGQGQIVWVDSDSPQGGTALPTSQITGSYVAPHYDGPNDPSRRDYLNDMSGGGVWETLRGPLPPGKKYNANGEVVNTTAFDKFDTGFGNAMKWGGIGLGLGAAGAAGGLALSGAYGAGAGAGGGAALGSGGAGGAGTGLAFTPEGVLLPAGAAGGGGAGVGGLTTADMILGAGGGGATIGVPTLGAASTASLLGAGTTALPYASAPLTNAAAGGFGAAPSAAAGVHGGLSSLAPAAGGGSHLASLASSYGPLLASVFGTLYGNRETSAEKAQAAAIEQQRKYLEYQMAKQKAQDPIQDALVRMAMGMMPTYSQNLFTNYHGLPGVSAPNANAHYSAPGIGGGGYGGNADGPSRR